MTTQHANFVAAKREPNKQKIIFLTICTFFLHFSLPTDSSVSHDCHRIRRRKRGGERITTAITIIYPVFTRQHKLDSTADRICRAKNFEKIKNEIGTELSAKAAIKTSLPAVIYRVRHVRDKGKPLNSQIRVLPCLHRLTKL